MVHPVLLEIDSLVKGFVGDDYSSRKLNSLPEIDNIVESLLVNENIFTVLEDGSYVVEKDDIELLLSWLPCHEPGSNDRFFETVMMVLVTWSEAGDSFVESCLNHFEKDACFAFVEALFEDNFFTLKDKNSSLNGMPVMRQLSNGELVVKADLDLFTAFTDWEAQVVVATTPDRFVAGVPFAKFYDLVRTAPRYADDSLLDQDGYEYGKLQLLKKHALR